MPEMVFCRGCGKEIHNTASACPACGASQRTGRNKSKVAAGLLAIFLGGLGIHRFYLGQWWGIFYLLLFWTWIPALVALVEGIVFLLSDQQKWDERYNGGIGTGAESSAVPIVIGFVAVGVVGISMVGILAAVAVPAYQDYTIRAKLQEAVNLSNPHRTSMGIACAERDLHAGQTNQYYGLANPSDYSGKYSQTIEVQVLNNSTAEVVITLNSIGSKIQQDDMIIYRGRCSAQGMEWEVGGNIPNTYLPRV